MATWIQTVIKNPIIAKMFDDKVVDETILKNSHYAVNKFVENYILCSVDLPCLQKINGFCYTIRLDNNRLVTGMARCAHGLAEDAKNVVKYNYVYYDFGEDNLKVDLRNDYDLKTNASRVKLAKYIADLSRIYLSRKSDAVYDRPAFCKGAYLYGNPGVGKTYFLIALANWFAKRNYKVGFINVTDLAAKLKDNFDENNSYSLVYRKLMSCDVLMLDDIGGEMISKWFRDEILFNLLNYRLNCKKITFFTSNYDLKTLNELYSGVKYENSNINSVKAQRLMERVRALAQCFEIKGESMRK